MEPRRDIDPYIVWAKREYNTPPDHLANAAMDHACGWEWQNDGELEQIKARLCGMKICIDGGRRAHSAAIAFAVYSFHISPEGQYFKLAWLRTELVKGTQSAFETEALALEWSLSIIYTFLGE